MENGKSFLIGFDASRAFVSEYTGTENYSLNLLKALAKVDRRNRYRVYLREISNFKFQISNYPKNFEFVQIKPGRLWTQVGLALETWKNPVDVLFIPAHTLPIFRRRKILNSKFENLNSKELCCFSSKNQKIKSKSSKFSVVSNFIILNLVSILSLGLRIFCFLSKETKYVVTIHDLGVEYLANYHKFPQRYYLDSASKYAARHADAIIAPSAATKADLVQRYGVCGKKVAIIAEGVDLKVFNKRSTKEIDRVRKRYKLPHNYILFVGTIQPRKNLKMAIEAFSEAFKIKTANWPANISKSRSKNSLQKDGFDCQFVLAGRMGWDFGDILEAPKKFGVESRVKFLRYVKSSDLPALYCGARLFVFPSLFEGFGLPVLEALACGTRVLASDIGTNREMVKTLNAERYTLYAKIGEPIVLLKPNDVDKWTQFLYQDISQYSKSNINESNEANLKEISGILATKFSWEEAARLTVSVFEKYR